ncbi:hypothetical protein [Terrisporobacter sp.]|uniref:hypothetical protein n=1 Tax=Terrisporobacter sp. TaxID=1965305 RepID=UPI00289C7D7E|nr:hypothetical protein [Terrisporobacter sp.]
MEEWTAYEVLKDILQGWEISDLYYFDFYKSDYTIRYGRKGYNYERQMNETEFNNLINIIKLMGKDMWIEIYD